jgi:integrase/recombinase
MPATNFNSTESEVACMPRKTKQNEITSPELLNQVNPDNVRLKQDFIAYLQSVQRSPKTIAGYSNDIDIFWVWNLQNNGNKFFPKISKRDYAAYQHWLINENGNSPARVRRLKSAISSLSNYVENILDDEDEFKDFRSTVRKIENPAMQQVRKKTVWSDEALDKLLDDLLASGQNKKACAVALAMCSGRRKAELCRFKVDDFKDENLVCGGALYKTSEPIQTKGFGLGKYIYCYTLAKKFKPYFDAWMAERQKLCIECEWLFPAGTTSEQMSDTTLNSWANTFSRMTGEDFYWHSLRHYFTTHLAKLGLPDNVIQDIVGWESADMVRVYKDLSAEEQISQYFDENGEIRSDAQKSLADL